MKLIRKLKIQNFGRFKQLTLNFDESINVIIGDNESGKSTILTAIDIVLSGSRNKVENQGIDSFFNTEAIEDFFSFGGNYKDLPVLYIELYMNDFHNKDLEGKYNSEDEYGHGLLLICEPREDLSKEIKEILDQDEKNFPFEYYSVNFKTFNGESYTGYRRYVQHILLDNTQINNEYATKAYVKTLYLNSVEEREKNRHQNEYRKHKEVFRENILHELNSRITDYSFSLKTNSKSNLESDLTIREGEIELERKGKGRQCFIKTDFALQKNQTELDVVLLEEPENHLSHINTKKLIERINESKNKQLFIATHSNLISSRLDLRKSILVNSNSITPVLLNMIPEETAKFFMKAPDNNVLQYVLSKKVILVEGDSEYILMEAFFKNEYGKSPHEEDIHIISVGGTSFKRYLDIAKLLDIKTAVIRDNDGDGKTNCAERYKNYLSNSVKVFYDLNDENSTFEVALYSSNIKTCDGLFSEGRKTLTVQEFMLKNKSESAFQLLQEEADNLVVPTYIKKAMEWIRA